MDGVHSKKIQAYLERHKSRKKKRPKKELTPEDILQLKRKAGKASAKKRAEKGRRTQHKRAMERKREQRRIKKLEQLQREKVLRKEKKVKERLHRKEIEKRRRKNAKKQAKRMMGNTYARIHYYIYLAHNGKINRSRSLVGKYRTYEKLAIDIERLKKENESVVFEMQYAVAKKTANPNKYEYIVCRRKFPDETDTVANAFFRNEYGRFVEHKLSKDNLDLYIIDKFEKKVEDTFWVYGYDPIRDRKTFLWIYENIANARFDSMYDMKRVYLYKNKIIFCNDNEKVDVVSCKCPADAIRFYNMMSSYCKGKRHLFVGKITNRSLLKDYIENLLAGASTI